MIKKAFLFVLCFMSLLAYFSILAYSDSAINSYFPKPEPKYEIRNGHIYIEIAWVKTSSNIYYLDEIKAEYPSNTHFYIKGSTAAGSMFRTDKQPISGTRHLYNLQTGALLQTESPNGVYLNETVGNLSLPNYFLWVNNTVDNGFYPNNANFTIETQGNTAYQIKWAAEIPQPTLYRSFVSEPISDLYNRYFILAGPQKKYLYHVSLLISEYDFIQTMWASDPGNAYQFQLKDILYPELQYDDLGFELYIELDSVWLTFVTANQADISLYYDIQVTRYNLENGQFIDSQLFKNFSIVQNNIRLNYEFDLGDDFDSVKTYGIFYKDQADNRHLNMLACIWSDDPQFVNWQNNVKNYLRDIYNILNQQGEAVTVAQDPSGMEAMEDARNQLVVNGSNGQPVDQVGQIENAFGQAEQGIQSIQAPVQTVNGIISNLFSINPIILVPIIVALALGLIVTILGKNKSD